MIKSLIGFASAGVTTHMAAKQYACPVCGHAVGLRIPNADAIAAERIRCLHCASVSFWITQRRAIPSDVAEVSGSWSSGAALHASEHRATGSVTMGDRPTRGIGASAPARDRSR